MEKKKAIETGINKHLSIITLNVNGLNSPIKRHRLSDCIKKQVQAICCLQETHLTTKDMHKLKVWKKIYQPFRNQKQARVAILMSDKADFMQK
jgi:exonuclease III